MSRTIGTARDGLRARLVGSWTEEKLIYVEKYAAAFATAMAPKRDEGKWESLVYVDLLAGPGICIERDSGREFEGSPLRALGILPAFDRLFFGDMNTRNIAALKARIPATCQGRVDCRRADCNERAQEIVDQLSPNALGLAFFDPEGFEVRFETLRDLSRRRIDLIYLFPSGIGITRNLQAFSKQTDSLMDGLYGSRSWRDLPRAKLAAGTALPAQEVLTLARPWVQHFRERVATLGYTHHDEGDPLLVTDRRARLYHLLFFSKHQAGLKLWRGIKAISPRGQRSLF